METMGGGAGEDRFSSTCRSLVTLSLHVNLCVETYDSHFQHLSFKESMPRFLTCL